MIPVSEPIIAPNAKKYLSEVLDSAWVSSLGPYVERFERKFAKFVGTKYAVATSSGTAAIHLSLAALNIGPGDEVIVPSLTMIAAALPIVYTCAKPVLVDVDPNTFCVDVKQIEKKINKKTKAIIVVHLNGNPADMAPLLKLAKKHHLAVIEDAAEAHGAEYKMPNGKWEKTGSIGNAGCFSFYGNKIITAGEGGMITTNDKKLADRARSLRNLARTPGKHFLHKEIAFAYRMSALQAALGLAELEEVKSFLARKKEITDMYNNLLSDIESLELPQSKPGIKSVNWQYSFILKKNSKLNRDSLAKFLEKNGIETRNFVIPLHLQPAFLKIGYFKNETYPISELLSEQGLSIPSGLAIKDSEIKTVARLLRESLL